MLPTFSQNLTLQETFETVAQMNEGIKRTEFDGAFCKKANKQTNKLPVDRFFFFHFLAKLRKSVEKMTYQKKK